MLRIPVALISAVLALTSLAGRELREVRPVQQPAPNPRHPQQAVPPDTVAHWCFAGPPGSVASDESSVTDTTGRFKAFIFGGPVYRLVENRAGLEFGGPADRVFVNDDPVFVLADGMTLEAVIRYDGPLPGIIDQGQIVIRGDDRAGLDPWFLAVRTDGRLLFHVIGDSGNYVQILSPAKLPAGRLVQVAGTLDCGSREMRLYIDRRPVCLAVTNIRPMRELDPRAKPGIGIGNVQSSTYNEVLNGLICEVRISNRALAPAEMLKAKVAPRRTRSEPEPVQRLRTYRGSLSK